MAAPYAGLPRLSVRRPEREKSARPALEAILDRHPDRGRAVI
ncbi:predicted protein [Streptomyces albidoflavus]|nr:predicted protein [Streptomyces albidoflavus]